MGRYHVQLRLAGTDELVWYVPYLTSERDLFCHVRACGARIPAGEEHARNRQNGQRLCGACVDAAEKGETASARAGNRRERHDKIARAHETAIRMLLDGLEVDSIRELRRLVDVAREHERDGAAERSRKER